MHFMIRILTNRNQKDFHRRTDIGTQGEGLKAEGELGKSKSQINGKPVKMEEYLFSWH